MVTMKIAIIHSFYRAGPSGENSAVLMQSKALAEAGHDVKVVSRSTDSLVGRTGYAFSSGVSVATGLGPSPLKEINKFNPDIVHVHNLFPNWGDRWVEKLEHPLILTLHNFRPMCAAGTFTLENSPCELCPTKGAHHGIKNKGYQGSAIRSIPLAAATRSPEKNRLLARADRLIFLHELSRGLYQKHIPALTRRHSEVITNFVEDVSAEFLESEHNRSDETPWVFIGRLSPEKGILPLIENWPLGKKLLVVGDGPQFQEAQFAARGKQIELAGYIAPESIPQLLRGASGVVFPSVAFEQSPLSFIEALRAGIPVLAKSGSIVAKEVAQHGCGAVFTSFGQLPDVIRQISEELEETGRRARHFFESSFTKEIWLREINRVYDSASD